MGLYIYKPDGLFERGRGKKIPPSLVHVLHPFQTSCDVCEELCVLKRFDDEKKMDHFPNEAGGKLGSVFAMLWEVGDDSKPSPLALAFLLIYAKYI